MHCQGSISTLNHKLRLELSSQLFNSLSSMFSFENSVDKVARFLSFVHVFEKPCFFQFQIICYFRTQKACRVDAWLLNSCFSTQLYIFPCWVMPPTLIMTVEAYKKPKPSIQCVTILICHMKASEICLDGQTCNYPNVQAHGFVKACFSEPGEPGSTFWKLAPHSLACSTAYDIM